MNSREKGKRGERQWRDELRANGYDARRGQQFSGSPDSPDVVSKALSWIHFEVKAVERLNIEDAIAQAVRDGAGKVPVVAHRRNRKDWLVTMPAEVFFEFLRGDLPPAASERSEVRGENRGSTPHPQPNDSFAAAQSALAGPAVDTGIPFAGRPLKSPIEAKRVAVGQSLVTSTTTDGGLGETRSTSEQFSGCGVCCGHQRNQQTTSRDITQL